VKTHFRVATYNIHYGGLGRSESLIRVLRNLEADAILLVEASNEQVLKEISQALGMDYIKTAFGKSHLAFLSHLPILNWNCYCPKHIQRPLLEMHLSLSPETEITLYGLHLQCHYFSWNERQRLRELETYLQYIKSQQPEFHLVMGDFNAIAPEDKFEKAFLPFKEKLMLWWERGRVYRDVIQKMQTEAYVDCFRALHPYENGFTLPTGMPHVRLDYLFANEEAAKFLVDCSVVTSHETVFASDHYPLVATFDF
jgi:endonuclease/exonuclease/phosphatase family metal-dependent hydrolase